MIERSAIPASLAASKILPSTSILTALVHSSRRAYLGLEEIRKAEIGQHTAETSITVNFTSVKRILKTICCHGGFYFFFSSIIFVVVSQYVGKVSQYFELHYTLRAKTIFFDIVIVICLMCFSQKEALFSRLRHDFPSGCWDKA